MLARAGWYWSCTKIAAGGLLARLAVGFFAALDDNHDNPPVLLRQASQHRARMPDRSDMGVLTIGTVVYDGRLQSAGFFKDYGSGRNNGPGGLLVRVRPDVDSLHRSDRRHHSRSGQLVCHHMQGMTGRLRYIGQEPGWTRHQGGG